MTNLQEIRPKSSRGCIYRIAMFTYCSYFY